MMFTILLLCNSRDLTNNCVGLFGQAPNENGEESDSDDDSMDEDDGQGGPSSSGQQDMTMELDAPPPAQGSSSKASPQQERPSTLTQEEMADGWQEAPARRKGRGGKRT